MTEQELFEKQKAEYIEEIEKHLGCIKALSFEQYNDNLTSFILTGSRTNVQLKGAVFYANIYDKRKIQLL